MYYKIYILDRIFTGCILDLVHPILAVHHVSAPPVIEAAERRVESRTPAPRPPLATLDRGRGARPAAGRRAAS
jgi:hypothetical protein